VGLADWRKKRAIRKKYSRQTAANLPKRLDFAQSIYTDIDVLRTLATDVSPQVRQSVALNSSISEDIIDVLLNDQNQLVRCNLAQRIDLSEAVIDQLSVDKSEVVQAAIAVREKLTEQQQLNLLNSGTSIRQKLALRKDLTEKNSLTLATDDDLRVRILLAGMTPSQITLNKLESDDSLEVRKVVAKRKGTYESKASEWQNSETFSKSGTRSERDFWIRTLSRDIFKKNLKEKN
jgi:hypothetical protein